MAKGGNDWRSAGKSPRGRRPAAGDTTGNTPVPGNAHGTGNKDRSDWRKKKLGADDRAHDEKLKGKDYLRKRDRTHEEKKKIHRLKVAAFVGAALLLSVVLIVYLLNDPRQLTVVKIIVTDYAAPIPPNSYALEDGELFNQLESNNQRNIVLAQNTSDFGDWNRDTFLSGVEQALVNVSPGGPSRSVVIYLSAHGVVNEQNVPCLLLSGADPLDSTSWLPINEVFRTINQAERLSSSRVKKLLILDSGRVDELWDAGIFYNGFPEALEHLLESSTEFKNFYVLHSCGPGEQNWSGPELNGSAFGHFVAQALSGAADRNSNNTITVDELYRYVRSHVASWSKLHRGAQQHPRLLPALTSDVSLALVPASRPELQSESDLNALTKSGKLDGLWRSHSALRNNPDTTHYNPLLWAKFQVDLVRLESLALAGEAYAVEYDDLFNAAENAASRLPAKPSSPPFGPINLALSAAGSKADLSPLEIRPLTEYLTRQASGSPPDPEKFFPDPVLKSYLPASYAAWQWLQNPAGNGLSETELKVARAMIEKAGAPAERFEPIEGHFMRMLAEHMDWAKVPGRPLETYVWQAVRTRATAEQSVMLPDERALYWVQTTLDEADAKRRLGEDHLFVGTKTDADRAQSLFMQAGYEPGQGLYGQALGDAKQLANAMETRDKAWADMRYLASWALRPHRSGSSQLVESLQALVKQSHALGIALETKLSLPEIAQLKQEVDAAHGRIIAHYRAESERVTVNASVDGDSTPDIREVLRHPLYTNEARNQLRRNLVEYYLSKSKSENPPGADVDPKDIKPSDDAYLLELAAYGAHPSLSMINPTTLRLPVRGNWAEVGGSSKPLGAQPSRREVISRLAEQGSELRKQLRLSMRDQGNTTGENLRRLMLLTTEALDNQSQQEPPVTMREGVSAADRLFRASAPLMPAVLSDWIANRSGTDPTHSLWKTDNYFQCLWLTNRTLDDYWGPRDSSGQSYFDLVAQRLLRDARQLLPDANYQQYQSVRLPQKLQELRASTTDPLAMSAKPMSVSSDSRDSELDASIQLRKPLPEGVAALFLSKINGQVFPFNVSGEMQRRIKLNVSEVKRETPVTPSVFPTGDGDSKLADASDVELHSLFRGHEYSLPVDIENGQVDPNTLVTEYTPVRRPEVEVLGDNQQKPSLLFVFDCSGSMQTEVPNSANEGKGKNLNRIQVARKNLQSILNAGRNSDDENLLIDRFRVGLMLYGHRAKYSEDGSGRIVLSKLVGNNVKPGSIDPRVDANVEFPIDDFTPEWRDRMSDYLNLADYWGQTPLYYSIEKAIKQFDGDGVPRDAPRQIIVITDGKDNPAQNQTNVLPAQITSLLKNPAYSNIRIDIVAFYFDGNAPQELKSIATNGDVLTVNQPNELYLRLKELLTPIKYSVARFDEKSDPALALPLGERWPVTQWKYAEVERDPKNAQYRVDLYGVEGDPVNTEFKLVGGEWLKMKYVKAAGRDRLEHMRYIPPNGQQGTERITKSYQQAKYRVTAYEPIRNGSKRTFDVAIQNNDNWPFTPRPEQIWVEIRPLGVTGSDGKPLVYNFFDDLFANDKPVPVYRCVISNWPSNARKAEVRVWFLMNALTPDIAESLTLHDSMRDLPNTKFPNSNLKVEVKSSGPQGALRITLTDQPTAGGNPHGIYVNVSPRPDQVIHRYLPDEAQHEFIYKIPPLTTPQLRLWSRKRLESESVPFEIDINSQPMVVEVPESSTG